MNTKGTTLRLCHRHRSLNQCQEPLSSADLLTLLGKPSTSTPPVLEARQASTSLTSRNQARAFRSTLFRNRRPREKERGLGISRRHSYTIGRRKASIPQTASQLFSKEAGQSTRFQLVQRSDHSSRRIGARNLHIARLTTNHRGRPQILQAGI